MQSISWPLERAKDLEARKNLTKSQRAGLWIAEWGILFWMSLLVAIIGSSVSTLTLWLQTLREGHCSTAWYLARPACEADKWVNWPNYVQFVVYVILSLVFAIIPACLVRLVAPEAAMSGITGLKSYFQGFHIVNLLNPKPLIVRLVGIVFAAASGLWIGQEAPLAYVGVALTQLLGRSLPISEARKRERGLAAAAVGIAVAFSAPLGGVLFALEVFVLDANVIPQKAIWMCFACSVIAIVMLEGIDTSTATWAGLLLPETGLFRVSFDRVWHGIEVIPFSLIGILGGIYGMCVNRVSAKARTIYEKYPISSVVVISLITSISAYFTEISRMPSMELLSDLFADCVTESTPDINLGGSNHSNKLCSDSHVWSLLFSFVLSSVLAPLSFTLRLPSGILFPSIVVGALGGRLMGLLMSIVLENLPIFLSTSFCPSSEQQCITPGVYALVGASSVLVGVTGLTISSVTIIMETTGALTFIVPIMIGVIISKWVSDTFGDTRTIYSSWQADENLPFLPDLQGAIPQIPAKSIMTMEVEKLSIEQALALQNREIGAFPETHHTCVPVVSEVTEEYKKLLIAKTGVEEPTVVLEPNSSLRLVISMMKELGLRVLIVAENGKFKGLITRADVVRQVSEQNVFDAAADEFEVEDTEN